MYLYLSKEDDFSEVPEALMGKFGHPVLVMEMELTPGHKLARADVMQVMEDLANQGYYLQMPPNLVPDMYYGNDM